jgi:micrococcal nuclease
VDVLETRVEGEALRAVGRGRLCPNEMKVGIQRWRRWAASLTEWHWVSGLIACILVLSIAIAVVDEGPDEKSSSENGFARPRIDPPATLVPIGSSSRSSVQALVVRVVDGDTVEVEGAVGHVTVRYIGVEAPETTPLNQPVGCFGREASNRNRELVEGRTVFLEKDVSETDPVGRLLRYVYLEDMQMVNELLIAEGFALASLSLPDVKHEDRLAAAQLQAHNAGRGLWGPACRPTTTPTSRPASVPSVPTQSPTPATPSSESCSPAYPTVCIPPPPPDLDCRQIPLRRFQVLPPDPHRFDPNSDGVGCEMG